MNSILMKAILSMDSYNRGYDAGITLSAAPDTKIGTAIIETNSTLELGSGNDSAIGFYAVSYNYNQRGQSGLISRPSQPR